MKIKIAKGLKKHLRVQKAQIRRTHGDTPARQEALNKLYEGLGLKHPAVDSADDTQS